MGKQQFSEAVRIEATTKTLEQICKQNEVAFVASFYDNDDKSITTMAMNISPAEISHCVEAMLADKLLRPAVIEAVVKTLIIELENEEPRKSAEQVMSGLLANIFSKKKG